MGEKINLASKLSPNPKLTPTTAPNGEQMPPTAQTSVGVFPQLPTLHPIARYLSGWRVTL
ncbi:hypothetical protein [Anabaena sp. CCY 9910]|uniref:hypothetical protein n=1 Tax=Anabaena sp. CCY 9910 TaxID=3103870 RepID=UPI0039DF7B95